MALCYFAGGSAYDIALVHGVAYTEVYKSVWKVVDTVNKCTELEIQFPDNWDKATETNCSPVSEEKQGWLWEVCWSC